MVNEMVQDGFFDATVCFCVCFKVHFIFSNAVRWLLHIDIGSFDVSIGCFCWNARNVEFFGNISMCYCYPNETGDNEILSPILKPLLTSAERQQPSTEGVLRKKVF